MQKDQADSVVEIGDLIDAADFLDTEQGDLKMFHNQFSAISKDRHCVLGNHCVDTLTKAEFLGGVEQANSYSSFDRSDFHFVVLDACFRADGKPNGRKTSWWNDASIPAGEVEWLPSDLKATNQKAVAFAHRRLDASNDHGVKNGPEVRTVFEESGRALAVFQDHSHPNDLKEISGIHRCALRAMVEGSGFDSNGHSVKEIASGGKIRRTGIRRQKGHDGKAGG